MSVTPGATPTEVNLGNAPAAQSGFLLGVWQASAPYPDPNNPQKFVRDVSVELPNLGGVDARTTTTETISTASQGKLVRLTNAGAIAVTLDSTVWNQFLCAVQVDGAGTATFTPSSGQINGASSVAIAGGSNLGGWLFFDGTNWWMLTGGGGGGGSSPLTTKGDLYTHSTVDARLPVGADKTVLMADSSQTDGIGWKTPRGNTFVPQLADGTGGTTNGNLASFDANGNVKDSGIAAAGVEVTPQPWDVLFNPNLVMGSGAIFDIAVFVRAVTFPGNFAGAQGHCRVNPGSTQTVTVNKNGSGIGTISISSSGVFTFATTGGAAVTYNAGDYMSFTNQSGADTSMQMQCTLTGTRA